jgi:hypothetical protein
VLLRSLAKKRDYRLAMLAETVRGMREGAFNYILATLLYAATASAAFVGVFDGAAALAQIIAYAYLSRKLRLSNAQRLYRWFCAALALTPLCFFFGANAGVLFAVGVGVAFCNCFSVNACSLMVYAACDAFGFAEKRRAENMALREMLFNIGRAAGQGLLLFFLFREARSEYVLMALGAFSLISAWLLGKVNLEEK